MFESFDKLLIKLDKLERKQSTLLVAIDGCGASGKSTFAKNLKELKPSIDVVSMDDFYLPSNKRFSGNPILKPIGADFNWKRLRDQVLEPLANNKNAKYQRYDWITDSLAEWHEISTDGIVIIEGVYSIRKELSDYYDFKIWIDCPRDIRLLRGIERDGEESLETWEHNWMIAEDIYMNEEKPYDSADLIIDGSKKLV